MHLLGCQIRTDFFFLDAAYFLIFSDFCGRSFSSVGDCYSSSFPRARAEQKTVGKSKPTCMTAPLDLYGHIAEQGVHSENYLAKC